MERKRGFTLIELFLTLGLIAIASSALLFKAKPMLDQYRYRHGVEKLKQEIAFSKKLSAISGADIEIEIVDQKSGLALLRSCDEPLNIPHTFQKWIHIPTIHLVGDKKITVIITGSGSVIGAERFTVSSGSQKTEITIVDGGVKKGHAL